MRSCYLKLKGLILRLIFGRARQGFTLVELMLSLTISALVMVMVLDYFSQMMFRAKFIQGSSNPYSDFTRLRYYLQRDMAFADRVTVSPSGDTLTLEGYMYRTTYRVPDAVSSSGVFVQQVDDPSLRYRVVYSFLSGVEGKNATLGAGIRDRSRIFRMGPRYDLKRMEMLPDSDFGSYLADGLSRTVSGAGTQPVFSYDGVNGVVRVRATYSRSDVIPARFGVARNERNRQYFMQVVPFDSRFVSRIIETTR
jgi:prepilin-type N-terminal cleavage/methylation domain-containing protein